MVDVYSDADYANGASPKRVFGMELRMHGNCAFWRSKRHNIIAGDTTEAELIAMSNETKQNLVDPAVMCWLEYHSEETDTMG